MADVFGRDNNTTNDRWVACYAMYHGYRLVRIETPLNRQDKNEIKFTLCVPEEDWKQLLQEFADPEVSILRKAFCDMSNILQSHVNRAFANGGTWSCFEVTKKN